MKDKRDAFVLSFILPLCFSPGISFAAILRSIMKRREAVLISNPNAGRGGKQREHEVARFCESLKRRGVEVEALNTCSASLIVPSPPETITSRAPSRATLVARRVASFGPQV